MEKMPIFLRKHKIQEDLKFLKELQLVMKMINDLFSLLKNLFINKKRVIITDNDYKEWRVDQCKYF
jgi:hypothetical protein